LERGLKGLELTGTRVRVKPGAVKNERGQHLDRKLVGVYNNFKDTPKDKLDFRELEEHGIT